MPRYTGDISIYSPGGAFGTCVTYPLCGWILDTMSWDAVFYITGGITVVWAILWMSFVYDMPEVDPFISETEKRYVIERRPYDESR